MDNTLNLNASEISTVRTGSQYIKLPLVDQTSSEATVQQVNIDGFTFTGLVTYNLRGDASLIIDLTTGIAYELCPVLPDAVAETTAPIASLTEKAELEAILKAS